MGSVNNVSHQRPNQVQHQGITEATTLQPTVDQAGSASPNEQAKAHAANAQKPPTLKTTLRDLGKSTFPPKEKGTGPKDRAAEEALKTQKRLATCLVNVIEDLGTFVDDQSQIQAVMALLEKTQGQGPEAVLEVLHQAKDMLWTPKAEATVRTATLSHKTERLPHLVKALAALELHEMRPLLLEVVRGLPDRAEQAAGKALSKLLTRMIFFNIDDPKHLQEVRTKLTSGASGGLATLRSAVDDLRRPALDDMVKNAGSTFRSKLYEEFMPVEKRLAKLVAALQATQLEWASIVKGVVVPRPLPVVPKA